MPGYTRHPISVVGSGFVGSIAAIGLASKGFKLRLIDPLSVEDHLKKVTDGRAISITQGARQFLDQHGLWSKLMPFAQALTVIHTTESKTAELKLSPADLGGIPLGYMVDSKHLKDILLTHISKNPLIDYVTGKVQTMSYVPPFDHAIDMVLENSQILRSSLVIGADGAQSSVAKLLNFRVHRWDYDQTAFVRTYQHLNAHRGHAYEKFLPTGPFAILPLPQNHSSIVWTVPTKLAEVLHSLKPVNFDAKAFTLMEEYKGLKPTTPLKSFPIKGQWMPFFTANRVALVGDAAHVIHPLAGQGFNLGIQDVAALVGTIEHGLSLGLDIGSLSLLHRYQKKQRIKHLSLIGITDGLNRLFSNEDTALRWIRTKGLEITASMPTLKQFFAAHGAHVNT